MLFNPLFLILVSPTPSPNAYHIRKDTNKMRFSLTYRTFETPGKLE